MQGNENNDTNILMKRANKHNRLSCLISTSISFHSMCLVIIKICGYVVYMFVKCIGLSQVCHKFVISLHSQIQTNAPPNRNHTIIELVLFGWLINRIYNKQQYNDQSVNCCKQPIKYI
jgi:hypothetical protein